MNDEELKRKDWQLMTGHGIIQTNAYLRVVIANQAEILSLMKQQSFDSIMQGLNHQIVRECQIVDQMVKSGIPDYPPIQKVE